MMKLLVRSATHAVVLMVLALAMGPKTHAQTTYYVSSSGGSDNAPASQAQNKATPWAHAPGMPAATEAAASYHPVPGDQIILRGCDTWTLNDQWNLTFSGSGGNAIVIGVDKSWYNTSACPNGWNRPIISGGGSWPGGATKAFIEMGAVSYVNIQWLEFTGLYWSGAGSGIYIDMGTASNVNIGPNNYFHGWSYGVGSLAGGNFSSAIYVGSGSGSPGNSVFSNAFDGADATHGAQSVFVGMTGYGPQVYQNYFAYQGSCLVGGFPSVHDNVFQTCGIPAVEAGLHNNVFEENTDPSGGGTFYNNVIMNATGTTTNSVIPMQLAPQAGDSSYVFNNIFINQPNAGTSPISCYSALSNPGGTCNVFNNTIECGADSEPTWSCMENGDHGPAYTTTIYTANHEITSGTPLNIKGGTIMQSPKPSILQSLSAATGQGFSSGSKFAPSSGNSATVGAGSDFASVCNGPIAARSSAAQAACLKDTTQAVSYDSSAHIVSYPARKPMNRPSGTWDAGAYQFSSASATQPLPPSGLTATVQ
jgi:hypothetical protein